MFGRDLGGVGGIIDMASARGVILAPSCSKYTKDNMGILGRPCVDK